MKINKQVKTALIAVVAVGATVVAQADLADDLMKQMDAEIAQVKEETKTEVAKEAVASVVKSVEAAQKAEDAGSEAVVAVQEMPNVAGADPNASGSFDVADKVAERTAAALKINKNEIGNFNHKTGRIVVIGEAGGADGRQERQEWQLGENTHNARKIRAVERQVENGYRTEF